MKDYSVKVIVATHKQYQMPKDDIYVPLYVGAAKNINSDNYLRDLGYEKDNTGENISLLNPGFCELTGLYWAWKNIDANYIGLVHYRRHFSMKNKKDFKSILTYDELKPYLGNVKVFVPKKRRYYVESLYSHYKHTHYENQLEETKKIIEEKYPDYIKCYNKILKHTYGHMFNMMIMEKYWFDEYCKWLFDILFELRERLDGSELNLFQSRFYGRISEIIFNVWLEYQKSMGKIKKGEIKEIPYVHMEKINWYKKGTAFLKAKFIGKKYERSF